MTARMSNRSADLARIHILKKDLHLSDDDYRGLLLSVCCVDSSAKLDQAGRGKLIAHMDRLKALYASQQKTAPKKPFKKLNPRQAKMYSLWQQLYAAQKVSDRKFSALEAWCKGQVGVDKIDWLTVGQLNQCIDSLKSWLARGNK
jgi:hypothetical protein